MLLIAAAIVCVGYAVLAKTPREVAAARYMLGATMTAIAAVGIIDLAF